MIKRLRARPSIQALRNSDVTEWILPNSNEPTVYTVKEDSSLAEVNKKIFSSENTECAVVVVRSNPNEVKGIIAEIDAYKWIINKADEGVDRSTIESTKAIEIANTKFVRVIKGETLNDALRKMKDNNLTHIVVLDKDEKYLGWIRKRDVLNRIGNILDP